MTYLVYALAFVGACTVAKWARELWRTRKDKGYDASKWGAF